MNKLSDITKEQIPSLSEEMLTKKNLFKPVCQDVSLDITFLFLSKLYWI